MGNTEAARNANVRGGGMGRGLLGLWNARAIYTDGSYMKHEP